MPKCRTILTGKKNGVLLKIYIKTRNSVPKWMSTDSTTTAPTTEFYCKNKPSYLLFSTMDCSSLTLKYLWHWQRLFQSVASCLKGYFKKTWPFQFNMESFQFINLISMSLSFKQWLDPFVDRSLTSVTKTTVFLRNSSAKSSTRIFQLKTFSMGSCI